MNVIVEVDRSSGFCFGVVNAILKSEECIAAGGGSGEGRGRLVSLGDIVHNEAEVARLEALGLGTVPEDADLATLAGRTVLIRAHGEPPATYDSARRHGISLIDATCPVVARLQKTVAAAHAKMMARGGQVVIFGRRGHAEVRGLAGHAGGDVVVVEDAAGLGLVDFDRPIYFLAQTTSSLSEFRRLGDEIRRRAVDPRSVTIRDTVCRRVSGREEHLAEFARRFDVVIFVAGAKSSNGRVLFEAVRVANTASHKIERSDGLRPEWFDGKTSVGICGATSTPKWLMNEIAEKIMQYDTSRQIP